MRLLVFFLALLSVAFSFDEVCLEDLEPGPCRALIKRYGYSLDEWKCVDFYYGGCHGNANNFKTMEECKKMCEM